MKKTGQFFKITFIILFTLRCALFVKSRDVAQQEPALIFNKFNANRDQDWNELGTYVANSSLPILTNIKDWLPELHANILLDSQDPYLPIFWGKSQNYDFASKGKIVDEKIIRELEDLFGITADSNGVHAGVMHSYGYLFSSLITPYGFKRKRWIDPDLNLGFEFAKKSLSPFPEDGAFLSNVTYFFGMLAFQDKSELKFIKNVSNEIFIFPYETTPYQKIIEELKDHVIITSLIELTGKKNQNTSEYKYLLIYLI